MGFCYLVQAHGVVRYFVWVLTVSLLECYALSQIQRKGRAIGVMR